MLGRSLLAVASLALAYCAPAAVTPALPPHAVPAPVSAASAPAAVTPAPPRAPVELHHQLPRATDVRCPVAFDDADVILAQVGDVTITACDVALAAARATREGRPARAPALWLRELVDDALGADEARVRGVETGATARRVRETLAAGLLRAETLAAVGANAPDDAEVERYYRAHAADFAAPERVHLREVVLATEARAAQTVADAAQTPFDQLVRERTVSPEGRRDEGDLGLVSQDGNDRVAAAVAAAGFALAAPGDVAARPIRVESTVLVGRRQRPRTTLTWHVVQLLARLPAETVPLANAARRIQHRLAFGRYQSAHAAAHQRLLHDLAAAHPVRVEPAALRRVRVSPARRASTAANGNARRR